MEDRDCPMLECECPMGHKFEKIENTLSQFSEWKTKQEVRTALFEQNMKNIVDKINEMYLDVKDLKNVPNKRYETIITAIITGIIGVVIGALFKGVV